MASLIDLGVAVTETPYPEHINDAQVMAEWWRTAVRETVARVTSITAADAGGYVIGTMLGKTANALSVLDDEVVTPLIRNRGDV